MKRDEGHFGYPMFEGMPELTTENHPRECWCLVIWGFVLAGFIACAALGSMLLF